MKNADYVTLEAALKLIEFVKKLEHKLFVKIMIYTGCRISEILALKFCDVDLINRTLTIPHLKASKKATIDLTPIKRRIPIAAVLLSDFTFHNNVTNHSAERQLFSFTRMTGFRIIRQAARDAGIKTFSGHDLHPHALRHTFAIHWIKQGGKIEMLQRYLGHADLSTTSIYLQFAPVDLQKEQDKIFGDPAALIV